MGSKPPFVELFANGACRQRLRKKQLEDVPRAKHDGVIMRVQGLGVWGFGFRVWGL